MEKYLNKLLEDSLNKSVCDIHFNIIENKCEVYFRQIDELIHYSTISCEMYEMFIQYIKFHAGLNVISSKIPQDGSFYSKKHEIYIRISTIPLLDYESLVLRLLKKENNNLEYLTDELKSISKFINLRNGLFIFTGPTGSGKSTTMYNILKYMQKIKKRKIITIEDPIEMIFPEFMQLQINAEKNLNYSTYLKSILRHDPDLIMIGEIRDQEVAKDVFRAVLTGHTVITTMHAKDLSGVIERFYDFGFFKSELKSILIGICNQRLYLNNSNELKIAYNYMLDQDIEKFIEGKILDEGIERKIIEGKKIKKS